MAKPQPKRLSVRELLRLVAELSPVEHEEFVEEMKLQGLRKELQKGEDDLDNGRSLPADQVIAELRARNKAFQENGSV
jgi:hypothetical protein